MAYNESFKSDLKEMFVGFVFDTSWDNPEWRIIGHEDEEELKKEMKNEGADVKFSFVVKIPLPDTTNWQKEKETIKTLVLGDVGKESKATETEQVKH